MGYRRRPGQPTAAARGRGDNRWPRSREGRLSSEARRWAEAWPGWEGSSYSERLEGDGHRAAAQAGRRCSSSGCSGCSSWEPSTSSGSSAMTPSRSASRSCRRPSSWGRCRSGSRRASTSATGRGRRCSRAWWRSPPGCSAWGLVNTSVQVGGAIGLAVLATLATEHTQGLLAAGEPSASALNSGFHLAYLIGAALVTAGIAVAVTLLRAEPEAADARGAEPARARPALSGAA